jgi:TolB-like protein/class 3 adenylate cyclase
MTGTRKLAAILAADVVGFSRLTGADEERMLARLRALRSDLIDPTIAVHNGRVFKRTGDGALVEFRSAVDALRCAAELQSSLIERNAGLPPERRIEFRVGIHVGDVVKESDGDLMGNDVNIAARLEGVANPGAICLSEDAYRQVKGRLEMVVRDFGVTRLKNISEPIRVYSVEVGNWPTDKPTPSMDNSSASRLSIVVLPSANIGGDPEQEYFADGITESLTTDLSRIARALVIGRNTAFAYKGKQVDLRHLGRELSVRYVLEGSIQRAGARMRVNVQLIEAETGAHIWAERFDKPLADLFDMQDEIVSRIASALNAQLVAAEARRAERSPSPDSMDLYFQGRACANRAPSPYHLAQARDFFERALTLDPGNIEALVGRAYVDVATASVLMPEDRDARFAASEAALTEALSLVPDHALAHLVLAILKIHSNRASDGIGECQQALALDRNLAAAHGFIGLAKIFVGRAEEAEVQIHEALRLSPHDMLAHVWVAFSGIAKGYLGQDEQAVERLHRAIKIDNSFSLAHFYCARALAGLRRMAEAHAAAQVGLALDPNFTISRFRATAPSNNLIFRAQHEQVLERMRKAGVPEV